MIASSILSNWLSGRRTVFWRNLNVRNAESLPFLYGLHAQPKTNTEHGFYALLATFTLAQITPRNPDFSLRNDGASIWKNAMHLSQEAQFSKGHLGNSIGYCWFALGNGTILCLCGMSSQQSSNKMANGTLAGRLRFLARTGKATRLTSAARA